MKSQIHELISLFNKGVSKTTIITGVLSALLLLSCNTSLTLEKRKYTGGFYVQINGPKKNISDDSSLPDKQSVSANTPLLPSSVSTEQKIYESKSEKKSVKPKRKISKNNQDANLANSGISKKKNIGNGKINQSKKTHHSNFQKAARNTGRFRTFEFLTALGISLGVLVVFLRKGRMKKISRWAKHNAKTSRFLITAFHLIIMSLGFFTGIVLNKAGVILSDTVGVIGAIGMILAMLFYPIRNAANKFFAHSYARQKTHDFLVCAFGLIGFMSLGNSMAAGKTSFQSKISIKSRYDIELTEKINNSKVADFFSNAFVSKNTTDMQTEQKQIAQIDTVGAILLILLIVLVSIAAGCGLAILSCSLSCSGYEVAAFLVVFGGGFLLILADVLLIRRIIGRMNSNKKVIVNESEIID